jgi:hypothetical protein
MRYPSTSCTSYDFQPQGRLADCKCTGFTSLLRSILSEWSEVFGVGRLDSATCNGDRATYLHIAAGGVFSSVREFVTTTKDANDVMRWFIKRKIGIAQIGKRQIFAKSANFRVECLKNLGTIKKLTWLQIHVRTRCRFWPVMGACQRGFVWTFHDTNSLL